MKIQNVQKFPNTGPPGKENGGLLFVRLAGA